MIPIARADIGPEEIDAVTDVLRSGMLAQGQRGFGYRVVGAPTRSPLRGGASGE